MPEIDYVVLADYVRQDAGMIHIMGAGIDTFYIPEGQPVAVPVGLAARITFTSRDEVGAEHSIRLSFQTSAGDELLAAEQNFRTPAPAPGVPEHWRTSAGIAFRFPLPIPGHGDYRLQVTLDDDPRLSRTVDVRAVAPPTGQS
jgi:hypothetical protein